MKHLKTIFFIPCLPYHVSVFLWINYLAFRDNDFSEMLMTGDIGRNEKFDNFIDKFDEYTMPLQYVYCMCFWIWLIFF